MSSCRPIVLFCASLGGDGVARNTVRLANALAADGAAVEVVTLRGGAMADEFAGPQHCTLQSGRLPRELALGAALPALRRKLRDLDPALAISMGNHAHLALWAALRGLGDLPRIYRISNDPEQTGQTAGKPLRRAGLRLVAADATRLICVSGRAARADVFRRARRDRRLHIVPNGVDIDEVRRRAAAMVGHPWLEDGQPYIVALGRVHEQKNYGRLIDALVLLHRSGRPDLRLLIMGRVSAVQRQTLMQQAAALGIAEAVRLEGEVANPFPLLARASVYTLPSLWEGASNSLLEALACGVPIVASRSAGNAPEVLGEGRYGVLTDPTDPREIARALLNQATPGTRTLPGDRAADFGVQAATEAACRVVRIALGQHGEFQIQPEARRHPGAVGLSGGRGGLEEI